MLVLDEWSFALISLLRSRENLYHKKRNHPITKNTMNTSSVPSITMKTSREHCVNENSSAGTLSTQAVKTISAEELR